MKQSFINLLREPDSVLFQYEDSGIRFEEPDGKEESNAKINYKVKSNYGEITLLPSDKPVKRIKLRWRGDMSDAQLVLGDAFERNYSYSFGFDLYGFWHAPIPEMKMPWYFHVYDGEKLNSFGVKTGPDAICYFQCDERGITLWLDVRNFRGGVSLKEPLVVAKVVCLEGNEGEDPLVTARNFCSIMCDNPVLPKSPIFGVNNWYWAYGNISHDSVMVETDQLMDMCADAVAKPFMILDDGWQSGRFKNEEGNVYNGGPWTTSTPAFPSMRDTAMAIREKGAIPGLWFRPLLAYGDLPSEIVSPYQNHPVGTMLDATHPEVLNMTYNSVKTMVDWGFGLIKHDFTTYDTIGLFDTLADGDAHFYDRSITNCTMLKNLFKTIQRAAGDNEVIGCNAANHLVAGIHSSQRSGHDTSGNSFEISRIAGAASFIRLPQNNTFFSVDPDCAAFTHRVPIDINLDFLEACANSGLVTLASVTPGILKGKDLSRIRAIYKTASLGGIDAVPNKWVGNNVPSKFTAKNGEKFEYDWYKVYDGIRTFYTWKN